MAKFKGYRTYFTGVEDFFFHDFFHKFCKWIGIDGKDYELNKILFEYDEFTKSEFHILYRPGNLSNQLSGKIASVSAVKIYSRHEDMYYKSGNDPWINLIRSRLIDLDYTEIINTVLNGIDSIIGKDEEIVRMQEDNLCQGYSKDVLLHLKDEILTVYNFMGIASKERYSECMARILMMTLTYFVANGTSFIQLGKERSVADYICNAYKAFVPDIYQAIPDFDSRLIADISYNGESANLYDVIKKEPGNIIITGDGGAGKSTMILRAANNLFHSGIPCVFIEAKEADNFSLFDPAKGYLLLNRILNIYPEWVNAEKSVNPYGLCHKILSDNLNTNKLVVFVDALNEATPYSQQSLINQISECLVATDKVQFILSSRYNTSLTEGFTEVKVRPLDPLRFLPEEKALSFKMLGDTEKNTFSTPLFTKILMDNDDAELKISVLLSKKYQREIGKAARKAIVDYSVVTDFICEFTYYLFCNYGRPVVFSLEQLKDYAENRNAVHSYEYIKEQLSLVFVLKDSRFSYNHETERDYLLARYIASQFENTESIYETCIQLFHGVKFPTFVLELLKEMLQARKNDIFKSLRQKSCGEQFYSENTAIATASVVEIFKDPKQLRGLNLTKCHFDNLIKNINFADSLMQPSTLAGNSINSAIFRICSDKDFIYAIGRGRLNVFDHSLSEKKSVDFKSDTNIVSCRQSNSRIIFVDKAGRCFVFDKLTSTVKRILTDKAVSVEIFDYFDRYGFLVGLDNGKFVVIDEETFGTEIIQTGENGYIIPMDKSDDNEYTYITASGDIYKFNTDNHVSEILWKSECMQKYLPYSEMLNSIRIKSALKITEGCYVLDFYKSGFTLLCYIDINVGNWQIIHIASSGNAIEAEETKSAYNIDYNKINDITFFGSVLFVATNSGFVNVFVKDNNGKWILSYQNSIDYTLYSHNPGDSVESVCAVNKNTLLFTSTTRGIYQVRYDIRDKDFIFALTNDVKGANNGVRRIIMSKDRQKLYAFCFNHSVVVYTRREDGCFGFSEKIDTGSGWVWAGCEDDCGRLYIACDENVFVYSKGKMELLQKFDAKVENLFFVPEKGKRKAMLLVAVGYRVEQFTFENSQATYAGKKVLGNKNNRYRPMSFILCKNSDLRTEEIAIACSSYKKEDGSIEPAAVFKLENSGSLRRFLQDDSLGGWFRSVEYDDKTGCYVCAGLKYDGNDAAIVFNHKQQMVYVLTGHRSYVSDAKIVESKNDTICIAVTGYDGSINLYSVTVGEKNLKPLRRKFINVSPFKSFNIQTSTLFNIVLDDNDLLVPSIEGKIYRLQNFLGNEEHSLIVEAENYNIFITDSDFSKANGVDMLNDALKTLNNKI